jgi:hypothetical protein
MRRRTFTQEMKRQYEVERQPSLIKKTLFVTRGLAQPEETLTKHRSCCKVCRISLYYSRSEEASLVGIGCKGNGPNARKSFNIIWFKHNSWLECRYMLSNIKDNLTIFRMIAFLQSEQEKFKMSSLTYTQSSGAPFTNV